MVQPLTSSHIYDLLLSLQLNQVLTGNHLLAGNPFAAGITTGFSPYAIWDKPFFLALKCVLSRDPNAVLNVLKVADDAGNLKPIHGIQIPGDFSWEQYQAWGVQFDFTLNGSECLFCDQRLDWAALSVVDVQAVGGKSAAMHCFFPNEADWTAENRLFLDWLESEPRYPAYEAMAHYPAFIHP